ncbi:hypothetical protein LXA43DRAFT_171212 [Ganoderma leucocontextum]|nr:hypothetical protein LXA43DRAFT_171212 [Ganoderma leucocontextum]
MDIRPSEDDKKGSNHRRPSGQPFPLPQELVDLIIETVDRSGCQHPREFTLATLNACSLVSKGWTTRAQRRMFQWADLYDTIGLHIFAETLRVSASSGVRREIDPGTAAHQLRLLPRLCGGPVSYSSGRPSSACLAFDVHSGMSSSSGPQPPALEDWGVIDVASGTWQGPYLLINPRFPLLLSSFSGLEELDLSFVVFQTFIDFARTLYAFKQIRTLRCGDVNWITLGILYLSPPSWKPRTLCRVVTHSCHTWRN